MAQHQQPAALHFWQQSLVFLAACAIVISRRPDAIYHAQFWAEDGHVWFADAYNYGWWAALFRTQDGYFQTLPRLAASFALVVPLSVAPLVLNLVAAALQALPVNLLLSSRSSSWGSLRDRAILAGIYLALPNCAEVSCGITESQWLLALSAFLMVAGTPPRNIKGRTFDFIILLLFGLTGPFCIFLLPVSVYLAIQRHEGWRWVLTGALVALSLVQAWGLLIMDTSGRPRVVLGDSVVMFVRIIGSQIYLGILLGSDK